MNIYVKQSSVSVTKVTMASFETRFLTIKVAKFASTEAKVLVITMVIPEIIGMYIFYVWFVVCKFPNDLHCSSVINWLIRVQ